MSDILERHRRLRTQQQEPTRSPYQELYGLRENPFPVMALFSPTVDDPKRNGDIYDEEFRRVEEKRFFEMFVQTPTGDMPQPLGFVRVDPQAGGRGNGKSVFLHHLMIRANARQWEDWPRDENSPELFVLSLHVLPEPRKQKRFWQLIRLIFQTLAEREILTIVDAELRAAILLDLVDERQIAQLEGKNENEVMQALKTSEGFSNLLAEFGLTITAYNERLIQRLAEISGGTIDSGFMSAFQAAGFQLTGLWINWQQSGIAVSDYQWRKFGTGWFLNGLVPVIMVAGYGRFLLLLDEFEKIYLYQSSREREEFLDEMRQHFYERDSIAVNRSFISTVLTTHPSIDRYLKDVWSRVGLDNLAPLDPQRIKQMSVELGKSTPERLSRLLMVYLDHFRMDKEQEGTLFPFEPDALVPAIEAALRYPRGTLWFADKILRNAAEAGMKPPIGRDFIEAFVASGQRPPIESDDEMFKLPKSDSLLTE